MHRIRSLIPLIVLLLTLPVGLLAAAELDTGENHRVIESRLRGEVLATLQERGMPLPQLRVYDAEGRQIADFDSGYSAATFPSRLTGTLVNRRPTDSPLTLEREVAWVMTPSGEDLDPLPPADVTVVEYWAEWCAPCHEQWDALEEVLAEHPELSVNVLRVEADPEKYPPQQDGADVMRADVSDIDPELVRKAKEGTLTPEEKRRLVEQVRAAQDKGGEGGS